MKELDKTKEYYLGNLSEEQRGVLYDYLLSVDDTYSDVEINDFNRVCKDYIFWDDREWEWCYSRKTDIVTDALELFEPQLQIGDTFEYNGFICEVKEKIEEKKWCVVDRGLDAYYTTLTEEGVFWLRAEDIRVEEITDQEFIKQLEKHSK